MSELWWAIICGTAVTWFTLYRMEKANYARYEHLLHKIDKLHESLSAPIIYATNQMQKDIEERDMRRRAAGD